MSDHSDAESDHENEEENHKDHKKPASNQPDAVEWTTESMNTLIHNVMSQTAPGEATPYHVRAIDWEKVSWDKYKSMECEKKWEELLTKVRHYRTLFEVATDMIGFLEKKKGSAKVTHWNKQLAKRGQCFLQNIYMQKKPSEPHQTKTCLQGFWNRSGKKEETGTSSVKKKKEKNPPGYPQKPRANAYSIFAQEKMGELRTSLRGSALMVEVGRQWGEQSEVEKQKYHERWEKEKTSYIDKLRKYGSNHPDDERMKKMIEDEERLRNHPKNKNKSKSTAGKSPKKLNFEKQIYNDLINKAETMAVNKLANKLNAEQNAVTDGSVESDVETAVNMNKLSPVKSADSKSTKMNEVKASTSQGSPSKSSYKKIKKEAKLNQSLESVLDSGVETNATLTESPVKTAKKRPNEEGDAYASNETLKKKKKHKKKKITGLEVYVEERKDAYKLEHPDLEDEEVESKLRRKYGKLSDKKMKKYEQLAAEMNF